jgi:hypothetical protein
MPRGIISEMMDRLAAMVRVVTFRDRQTGSKIMMMINLVYHVCQTGKDAHPSTHLGGR